MLGRRSPACGAPSGHRASSEASLLAGLAGVCSINGLVAQAERHFAAAFALLDWLGQADSVMAMNMLNNWSTLNDHVGDARRSIELLDRALAMTAPGAPRSPFLVFNRGRALDLLGRWDEAEASLREALQLGEQARAPVVKQHAAAGLAWLALERGDLSQTRVWLAEFYAYGGEVGKSVLATQVEGGLALREGNLDAAMASVTPIIESQRPLPSTVNALLLRAEVQQRSGRLDGALDDARAAVALARRLQGDQRDSVRTGVARLALARLLTQAGRPGDGRREAADALAMLERSVDGSHPALGQARALAAPQPSAA